VIGHPEGIEAELFGAFGHGTEIVPAEGAVPHAAGNGGDEYPDL
jgi:hypothetical protein